MMAGTKRCLVARPGLSHLSRRAAGHDSMLRMVRGVCPWFLRFLIVRKGVMLRGGGARPEQGSAVGQSEQLLGRVASRGMPKVQSSKLWLSATSGDLLAQKPKPRAQRAPDIPDRGKEVYQRPVRLMASSV
jgi:hypothetical protein